MADDTGAGASSPRKPSEKEALFFLTILGAMKNKPEVDWTLVAERAGYNNANTAKVRFGQIKRALGFNEDGTQSATPITPKPRAKKASKVGSGTNTTPTKVVKKRTPSKKKAKSAEVVDDAQDGAEANMNDHHAYEGGDEEVEYYDEPIEQENYQ